MDNKKDSQVYEYKYLYIEEEMPPIQVIQEENKEEIQRGVHIINIFTDDEEN